MRLHNRQIKATFWNDTDLLQWPRDKRWFYEGLIQLADDSGCLEDSTFAFKLCLFPSPIDADITVELLAEWRDELIDEEKLVRYRVGKKDFLYLTNFHKHQSLKNPEKPDVPLPPWIRWEPYESNNRTGKYAVSDDILTNFLHSSYDILPIEIEREEKRREREVNNAAYVEENGTEPNRTEEKGNEAAPPSTLSPSPSDSETIKDKIQRSAEACGLKKISIYSLERLFSFIDVVDTEVIIAAIKIAQNKHVNYAINTLTEWIAEGKTTLESINPSVVLNKNHSPPKSRADDAEKTREYLAKLEKLQQEKKARLAHAGT